MVEITRRAAQLASLALRRSWSSVAFAFMPTINVAVHTAIRCVAWETVCHSERIRRRPAVQGSVTLGLSASSCQGSRPFSGSSTISLFSIMVPTDVVEVSTICAFPSTSTVCVICPGCRVKSTRATWPTCRVIFLRAAV
jgi:hypothetical protein